MLLTCRTHYFRDGPPEALEYVRFGDGWALYDLTDVPERLDPERVAAALKPRRGKTKPKR